MNSNSEIIHQDDLQSGRERKEEKDVNRHTSIMSIFH